MAGAKHFLLEGFKDRVVEADARLANEKDADLRPIIVNAAPLMSSWMPCGTLTSTFCVARPIMWSMRKRAIGPYWSCSSSKATRVAVRIMATPTSSLEPGSGPAQILSHSFSMFSRFAIRATPPLESL